VVGFSVVRSTWRNLLAALTAHCAALVMGGDCIGGHRQTEVRHRESENVGRPPQPGSFHRDRLVIRPPWALSRFPRM
jgi:hypothetical protein